MRPRTVGWLAAVGVALALTAAAAARSAGPEGTAVGPSAATDEPARWTAVLQTLDAERARAWRSGDVSALRRVYTAGSPALRADRRMLAAYQARGLRPSGVRLEFASVEVSSAGPHRVTLQAVDRLRQMHIRAADGSVTALPGDEPTSHTIVLREVDGRWLIASVRAQ
jgi:hypothetical protein